MSVGLDAAASMAVLFAGGALPVLAGVGLRWPALVLAPLAGSVLAAVGAMATLAVGGNPLGWFVGLSVLGAAASLGWWTLSGRWPGLAGPRGRHAAAPVPSSPAGLRWGGALAALASITAAVVWSLRALRVPRVGFDARAIYLLHAQWFAAGHQVALSTLRSPSLIFSQQTYPPLSSAAVAVSWLVVGGRSLRLGVVVIALLNACAVAAAAWVVAEVGRRAADRVLVVRTGTRPGPAWAWALVPLAVGVVAAGLVALAAFGAAGDGAVDGYADLLWSAAAIGAVGFGLTLSGQGSDLAAAVVLVGVAGLTKSDGIPPAMAVVALMALRAAWRAWHRAPGRVPWRPLVAGAAGIVALGAWPVEVRLLRATAIGAGTHPGSASSRIHQTLSGVAPYLHALELAVPVALVGWLLAGRARRTIPLGNDLLAWAVVAVYAGCLFFVYVTTNGSVALRLATSVTRTTVFLQLAGWYLLGVWAVVGATAPGLTVAERPAAAPPTPAPTGADPEPAVEAGQGSEAVASRR